MQNGSAKPLHVENQNRTAKKFGKRSWHNMTVNVVGTRRTTSPTSSPRRQSKSPPVLAINASTSLFTRSDLLSLSSTLPSIATLTCAVCYDSAHSTPDCPPLPRKELLGTTAVRKRHLRKKNTSDRTKRFFNPNRRFSKNDHFRINRHPSSSA